MSQFLTGGIALRVILSFAAAYFMSFGLRGVNAVLAPYLSAEFSLSNASLGALTAAYFFGFTIMQLPLGVLLDKFGSRRVHAGLLLVAAGGCLVHAAAQSLTWLFIGRAMIGFGVAAGLMAAFKAYRFWFEASQQPQLVAWMMVAGTAGALTTTVPVQMAAPVIGWRGVFVVSAAIIFFSAIAVFFLLPKTEEQASAARLNQQSGSLWAGYGEIFRSPFFWRFSVFTIAFHSSFIALQTLWVGPWAIKVLGLSQVESARLLFSFNLVLLLGFLAMGKLVPWLQARGWSVSNMALAAGIGSIVSQAFIVGIEQAGHWIFFLALAATGTLFNTIQPFVGASFPIALSGRALTAYNTMIFGGLFAVQWAFGILVDMLVAAKMPESQAFRATLAAWMLIQIVVIILFWRWRPPAPKT